MTESSLRHLRIEDYHYDLPEDRIALYPLPERDASKMLVYRFIPQDGKFPVSEADGERQGGQSGKPEERIEVARFREITQYLPHPSLLVFNNTRVVRARLIFSKKPMEAKNTKAGVGRQEPARIEIFCLEPTEPADIAQAFASTRSCRFKCLIGNNKRWKEGSVSLKFPLPAKNSDQEPVTEAPSSGMGKDTPDTGILEARKIGILDDAFEVEFSWTPESLSFAEVLEQAGKVPLPPYLHRQAEDSDTERYQTVFARFDGSVAAPTAGLHFTPSIIESLPKEDIERAFVTLHVGAGTFKPVKEEEIGNHTMHQEHISVTRDCIEHLLEAFHDKRPVIPVGTTSMRSLESVYWIGVRLHHQPDLKPEQLEIHQWDPYESLTGQRVSPEQSLEAILTFMDRYKIEELHSITSLMIAPGYQFGFCQGLITNFHQPKSTLLLLVSALIGQEWKKIYEFALKNEFRFLSYGDCCLFLKV